MTVGSKSSLSINKFEVTSNTNGTTFDIARGDPNNGVPGKTPVVEYRESILTPFVEIRTVIVDDGTAIPDGDGFVSVMEGLEIEGGEVVKFKITDGTGNVIDLTSGNLRLQKPGVTLQAYKSTQTDFTIVSKQLLDNTLVKYKYSEKLEGKISDVVGRILQHLEVSASYGRDQTANELTNEFGEARSPFEIILDLQPLAIPEGVSGGDGKCAGYLFWETSEGIYFKSIHKMFEGREVGKFIFNNKVEDIPSGFTDKILDYKVERTVDVLKNLEMGTYATEMHVFDEVSQLYDKEQRLLSPDDGNGPIAGRKLPLSGSEYFNEPSLRLVADVPLGGFTLGDDIETQTRKSVDPAFSIQQTVQQSLQAYRQKFTIAAEITLPCNLSLHAGDLIYCDFPENARKRTLRRNPQSSGIYMISDLCHYSNSTQAFTKLRLIRDSFGVR